MLVALAVTGAFVLMLAMTGCGSTGGGKGLSAAYDSLKVIAPDCVAYDEATNTLTVLNFGEIENVDEIFDVLDAAVKGEDIGRLAFERVERGGDGASGRADEASAKQDEAVSMQDDDDQADNLCARLGSLPCASMVCLDIRGIDAYLDDGSWTSILSKTDALLMDDYELQFLGDYDDEQANLAVLKSLWLDSDVDSGNFKYVDALPGLEEIRFVTTGTGVTESEDVGKAEGADTASDKEKDTDAISDKAQDSDVEAGKAEKTAQGEAGDDSAQADTENGVDAAPTESGSDSKEDAGEVPDFDWDEFSSEDLQALQGLGSLERILFFPDSEEWKVDDEYYTFVIALQDTLPDLLTNAAGSGWDGDEGSLVTLSSIDAVGSTKDKAGLEKWLAEQRENEATAYALALGEDFEAVDGKPTLDGKCLVFIDGAEETGWEDSPDYTDMANYLYSIRKVLDKELDGTGIETPERIFDFDYFVLVYPTFEQVGTYGDSTEAYATTANVRVYDMNAKTRYADKKAGTATPPDTYSYTGKPVEKYYTALDESAVVSYLSGLVKPSDDQ